MNDMRQFDLHKIFFGDVSLGEPIGMATEAKSRRRTVNLTPTAIKAIESILSKGDRAEVIPTKEGPKVVRITRSPVMSGGVKTPPSTPNPNPNYVPPGCGKIK